MPSSDMENLARAGPSSLPPPHSVAVVSPPGSPQYTSRTPTVIIDDSASSHLEEPVHERANIRLAASFFALFTLGWGDGVTGTLLPYFKEEFHLSFLTSSLFFVASFSGFWLGTILVEHITRFLGLGLASPTIKPGPLPRLRRPCRGDEHLADYVVGFSSSRSRFMTVMLSSMLHSTFFIIMGTEAGFPSMMVAYFLSAFARSFLSVTMNVYVSSISPRGLGNMYGFWALGAFCAPLVCQSIVATGIRWANFYFGSLVLSGINLTFMVYAFRPTENELQRDADSMFAPTPITIPQTPMEMEKSEKTVATPIETLPVVLAATAKPKSAYGPALRQPQLWASAIFAMLYTGSENSTAGFIVLYLLNVRHADPRTAGYVTSGFWGGMALGRFIWAYLARIVSFRQRKYIIQACILLTTCQTREVVSFSMQLLIWFVPSYVANAVSTAVIGFICGPIYPANLGAARDLLPPQVHMVSLAMIAACASFGSALFPFITGVVSTAKGPQVLTYITVAQTSVLFVVWAFSPSRLPTRE